MVKSPQDHWNLVTRATVRWDLRAAARRSFWSPGCRVPQSRWCHCHPWLVEQLEIGIYFHQQKCVFFTIEMGYYGEVTGHIFFPQKLTGICGNDVDVRLTPWTPYCLAKKRRGDFVGYKYTAKENMNEICNLSQLNALFAEGKKTHVPWPKIGATDLEAGLPILVSWPQLNTGSKCATAAASWQQHKSVILRGYMPEKLALPFIRSSGFGALGPPRLWEKAPQCLNKNHQDMRYESQWLGCKTTKEFMKNY